MALVGRFEVADCIPILLPDPTVATRITIGLKHGV
jgi:hypothetical protein